MFISKLWTWNDLMKVAILSLYRYEHGNVGQGIARVVNELYKNLYEISKTDKNLEVKKIVPKNLKFDSVSFRSASLSEDLSKYDIVHNPIGFLRINKGKAKY